MKNSLLVLSGNISYAFANWFILFYFIKFESPINLGIFGLVLSITTPLIVFLNFQIRSLQAVDIDSKYKYYDYSFFRNITFIIGIIVIVSIAFFMGEYKSLFWAIALMKLIDSLSEVNYGAFQLNRFIWALAVSKIMKSISIISIVGLNIIFKFDLNIMFNFISILLIIIYLGELIILRNLIGVKLLGKVDTKTLRNIFKYGLPLMIATFLGSLNSNIPRYVLGTIESLEAIGYYTAFVYIISVGNIFVSSIAQVYITPLTKIWQSGNYEKIMKSLVNTLRNIIILFGFLLTIGVVSSDFIIKLFFGEKYLEFKVEYILTLIAATVNYIGAILGYFNVATKKFGELVKLSIIWIICTIISSLILIFFLGLKGAFISLIISNIIILITRIWLLQKFLNNVK